VASHQKFGLGLDPAGSTGREPAASGRAARPDGPSAQLKFYRFDGEADMLPNVGGTTADTAAKV